MKGRLLFAALVAVAGGGLVSACQEPTQITLELSTDVPCAEVSETSITTGAPGTIASREPATTTQRCDTATVNETHRIGSLVLVPSGDDDAVVSVRIVSGIGKSAADCVDDGYKRRADEPLGTGCIVARRELGYVSATPLRLPIEMEQDCIDVPCDAERTCVNGRCVSSKAVCKGSTCTPEEEPDAGNESEAGAGGAGGRDGGVEGGTGGKDASVEGGAGGAGDGASPESSADAEAGCPAVGARLRALSLSTGALDSRFDPCAFEYSVSVGLVVQSLQVTPEAGDPRATIRVDGQSVSSGAASGAIPLPIGPTQVYVTVSIPGGETLTYTLNVTRESALASDTPPEPEQPRLGFGQAIALSGDTLVVGSGGAPLPDGGLVTEYGVHMFVRSGDTWVQQAFVHGTGFDQFGASVALSGNTLVVGAPGNTSGGRGIDGDPADAGLSYAGAAYVFVRSGSTWTQQAYLKGSNTDADDQFGSAVAVSGDTIAVAAYYEAGTGQGVDAGQTQDEALAGGAGAVYVFVRSGTEWSQEEYIKASNAGAYDRFGTSVALSGDTLLVGAPGEGSSARGIAGTQTDNGSYESGAAYLFSRSGGNWTQQAYIKASNTEPTAPYTPNIIVSSQGEQFGSSVALDGSRFVVGALMEMGSSPGVDGDQFNKTTGYSGAVYVFARSGVSLEQEAYLKASIPSAFGFFGSAVALSGDTLVVSASGEPVGGINWVGAAYLFVRSGSTWAERARLGPTTPVARLMYGRGLALFGDTFAVGSSNEDADGDGLADGMVEIFH